MDAREPIADPQNSPTTVSPNVPPDEDASAADPADHKGASYQHVEGGNSGALAGASVAGSHPARQGRNPAHRLRGPNDPVYWLMHSARKRKLAAHRARVRAVWTGVLLIFAVLGYFVSMAAVYYQSEEPLIAAMGRAVAARDSARIFDSQDTLLYQLDRDGAQQSIPLAHIPVVVVNATLATEDHDFWNNAGVDFQAMARAAYADFTTGHIQEGASTVTQQLIKQNVLSSNVTLTRKLQEIILSLGLTAQGVFTKSQLLQMYLNSISYGPTVYGIDAAASAYFGYRDDPVTGETAAQHLDLAQASMLAGIPQSPVANDPLTGPAGFEHARARQHIVLDAMAQLGEISPTQVDAAWQEAGQPHFLQPRFGAPNLAPHFVQYVEQQLAQLVDSGQLRGVQSQDLARSGLNIYTTLDVDLQNQVQQAMLDHLCGNDLNDYPGSSKRYIRDDNVTNAAAVMVDHHTGAIRVLLGSMDYYGNKTCHPDVNGQFDVATQGYRQPGSSFKPIVYATAFEHGWSPATIVHNEPTTFQDPGSGPYRPHDADTNHLAANMTIRNALQLSQNIPAVETMQFAGIQTVERNAQLWGIHDWQGIWGLSSAIGSLDVHPIDMVQAYTVFANQGLYIPLHAIDRITDATGRVLYQYQQPKPVQVLSPQVAFLLTSVLSDNPARIPEFNYCSPMYLDPSPSDCAAYHGNSPNVWPAAAKTGTADDLTNDWTMGYTMDYTMGVWVGNNDSSPMQWVDGVTGAAPIWYRGMLAAERNLPKTPFPVPSGVHRAASTAGGSTIDWVIDGQTPQLKAGPSK